MQCMKNVYIRAAEQNSACATSQIDITYRVLPKYNKTEDELNPFKISRHFRSSHNIRKGF